MTIAQTLARAIVAGLDRLDAQLLLLHVLGRGPRDRAWLLAHDGDDLGDAMLQAFQGLCARRAAGEPLAYLVGRKEFFGLDLTVDARVLVPRPDTETLVEWALALIPTEAVRRVIDLGTGSGAIALAIKHHRPRAEVHAVDASVEALTVARENAAALALDVLLRRGHWLDDDHDRYDLIVSNPPYIAEGDSHLARLQHEPGQALVAGPDGLSDLRRIVAQAPAHLKAGGWLLLEHGYDQAAAVRDLLAAAGFSDIASRRDLGGNERCTGGRWLELG